MHIDGEVVVLHQLLDDSHVDRQRGADGFVKILEEKG